MNNRMLVRRGARCAALAIVCGWVAVPAADGALAQALSHVWPARPVTVVIPFTAGTTVDISARVVMDQVSRQVGQPVIIENRGGAGGTIGTNMVAKAAPDGHSLLVSGSLASANALYVNLPYETLRDFTPVISMGLQPLVLVTGPTKGFKTLGDLIAAGKARPGALNFASGGVGSATHFGAERFRISAGIEAQHIPFRGATEGLTEIMAGRVDFYLAPIPSVLAQIKEGKVVALAVSATRKSAVLPDVPTTTELGLVDSAYSLYAGLYAPAKTARDIIGRIHQEIEKALSVPAVQERMRTLGAEPMPMSQEEFDKYFRADVEGNVKLVEAARIPKQQ
jgi:tripartite-type tricarboxylate transporter receptor subunit TctC